MVAGFHLIWTAYGWWLPNDPRGSSSHRFAIERIAELGRCTAVAKRCSRCPLICTRSISGRPERLMHGALQFEAADRDIVAAAIGDVIARRADYCSACRMGDADHRSLLDSQAQASRGEDDCEHAG